MSRLPLVCRTRPRSLISLLLHYALPVLTHRTDRQVAERSILIKNLLEDIGDQTVDEAVPIPNVSLQHPMVTQSRS